MEEFTVKPEKNGSFFLRVLPDIIAYFLGLAIAYFLHWETRDLVWSLWLSSLVIGYLTILSGIAGGVILAVYTVRTGDISTRFSTAAYLIIAAVASFILVFFSFHFCGFHAGHSVFLNHFFPIDGLKTEELMNAFMSPVALWIIVFRYIAPSYAIFLLATVIAERKYLLQPLLKMIHRIRTGEPKTRVSDFLNSAGDKKPKNDIGKEFFGRPYLNVVRMHLLIFFFAFCFMMKIDSFYVYAVVYSVYFFPWKEVKESIF